MISPMKIKNIIFDVGNVIVRWSPIHIIEKTFPNLSTQEHRILLEKIFKSDTWINLNLGTISENTAKLNFISSIEVFDQSKADTLFDYIKSTQELIPGTTNIIKTLHTNNYLLFALTDNVKEIMIYLQKRYDFWQYFSDVIVSANIGLKKPGKKIFEYALKKNNLKAQETIFIDDHLPNIEAANALGLHVILFSNAIDCLESLCNLGVNAHVST